jgi:ATP-dependent DNA helicase RecQ
LLYNEKDLEDLKAQVEIRFPNLETIRNIYQSLMNYLQLPINSGEGNYYGFDIVEFTRKFKLEAPKVWSTLKVLEQEDLISYTDFAYVASTVQFTTNKELLYDFEMTHPELEPIIKALLRTYEGIFDYPAKIHEKTIAWLLKEEESTIKTSLGLLQSFRIIHYEPQKDSPQVFFPKNRVAAEELTINQAQHHKRKLEYMNRIHSMIDYVKKSSACRSILIAEYFNDKTVEACGVCDNCLAINIVSPEQFKSISEKVFIELKKQKLPIKQLLAALPGVSSRKALHVIQFMQSENKISVGADGFLSVT